MKTSSVKKYKLEELLSKLGRFHWFHSSKHRGVFLYVLLDTKKYERCCKNCGKKVEDLTQHGLKDCTGVKHQRVVYNLKMKLYDAPEGTKLMNKRDAIRTALTKNCYMKALCDFLVVIWNWNFLELT